MWIVGEAAPGRGCDEPELKNSHWFLCLQGHVQTLSMCLRFSRKSCPRGCGNTGPWHSQYTSWPVSAWEVCTDRPLGTRGVCFPWSGHLMTNALAPGVASSFFCLVTPRLFTDFISFAVWYLSRQTNPSRVGCEGGLGPSSTMTDDRVQAS